MSLDDRLTWIRELQGRSTKSDANSGAAPELRRWELRELVGHIDQFNASQPNSSMLQDIRAYNHLIIGEFNKITSLRGATILDIGASPHYYAMEKCFQAGVSRYIGVGLDIDEDESMLVGDADGHLLNMNAECLTLEDASVDCVVSMSTFEHIGDVPKALSEIERVLKPGGKVLISFEPLWTCAYGHHLHHLGEVSALVPPWAHLVWDRERMREHLVAVMPSGAARHSVDELVSLMFADRFINRIRIDRMRQLFRDCPMDIEWMLPMMHERHDHPMLAQAQEATALSADDLHTKGLSVLLKKRASLVQ